MSFFQSGQIFPDELKSVSGDHRKYPNLTANTLQLSQRQFTDSMGRMIADPSAIQLLDDPAILGM